MKIHKSGTLLLLLVTLLTGCWSSKDLQTMAYATTLVIDYVEDKYVIHAQFLNFSNIAKNESTQIGQEVPIWIGKSEGTTVTEAMTTFYATSQLRVFWGHLKAIVVTENMMKRGLREVYDEMNRFHQIRFNVLIYGTNEPATKLLSLKSLLNFSPLESLLARPGQFYDQKSLILPVYGFKFIAQLNEAGNSTLLPSLSIRNGIWTEDTTNKGMFDIDGAYFFNDLEYTAWMPISDLLGARWLQTKLSRSPINVPNDKPFAALMVQNPKFVITPLIEGDEVRYNIEVKLSSYVNELRENISENDLKKAAEKVIEDEIRTTYNKAILKKVDVYMLSKTLYRGHPHVWKRIYNKKEFPLKKDSLNEIKVDIHIEHYGKYKDRLYEKKG
ncbi:Ger(x)C family spore germination protein [Paenibacillus sp. FJAT-26967]|uniref:Ger(x)C family spore germination protein n=1 Tax=Paenibacillus sp. FJAT-26967 TaxID=1729690 RepID=UPI000837B9FC|nr:Ger(x)C family spore germination protein [Paenibacillus sp. FJAT-26967]